MHRSGKGVGSSAMASSPRHRKAWILLLAALSLPAWEIGHAFVHEHLAHHHGEHAHADGAPSHHHWKAATGANEGHGPFMASDDRAHEHGHLEAVLVPASRSDDASMRVALTSASPEPATASTSVARIAQERAPPRAGPEESDPSHPRAPPHA